MLVLGMAACLLTACSTPQKSHESLTLWDMLSTANVERVDGGVTYVNRTVPANGYIYPFGARYHRYPPFWLGGFQPYYSLYYPYYGYRPYYVWHCPVTRRPLYDAFPNPVIVAGQPPLNDGFEQPLEPVPALAPLHTVSNRYTPYAIPESGSRFGIEEPFVPRVPFVQGSPGFQSDPFRSIGGLSDTTTGLKYQPGGTDPGRGIELPNYPRSPDARSQGRSSAFGRAGGSRSAGAPTRPVRGISRPVRAPTIRSSSASSARPQKQR